jgi:hypothetical protein
MKFLICNLALPLLMLVVDKAVILPSTVAFTNPVVARRYPRPSSSISETKASWDATAESKDDGTFGSTSWSVADNWRVLSEALQSQDSEQFVHLSSHNSKGEYEELDHTTLAALRMQNYGMNPEPANAATPEEEWMYDVIGQIVSDDPESESPTDTSSSSGGLHTERFLDDMGREIAMLVRCNENPRQMLTEQGRFVPELSEAQRNDVQQLVTRSAASDSKEATWQATPFLKEAVKAMFQVHAVAVHAQAAGLESTETTMMLDSKALASWMSRCLQSETVGSHDKRVSQMLARHGRRGFMSESDLVDFYVSTVCGSNKSGRPDSNGPWTTVQQLEQYRSPEIQAVWRDLRNHGLVSPAEFQRTMQMAAMEMTAHDADSVDEFYASYNILDECEILEDHAGSPPSDVSLTTDRQGKSSHERLDLYRNVPIWLRDGDFGTCEAESKDLFALMFLTIVLCYST